MKNLFHFHKNHIIKEILMYFINNFTYKLLNPLRELASIRRPLLVIY
jgi:hypothetical protein